MLHSAAKSPSSRTVIASMFMCCSTWLPPGFFIRKHFLMWPHYGTLLTFRKGAVSGWWPRPHYRINTRLLILAYYLRVWVGWLYID